MALTVDGKVFSWGEGEDGELGDGDLLLREDGDERVLDLDLSSGVHPAAKEIDGQSRHGRPTLQGPHSARKGCSRCEDLELGHPH